MYLILSDGTKITHIGATGATKYIQGANRDTITFEFDASHNVDELRNLFTEQNCEVIDIVTEEVVALEDGTEKTIATDNYHEGYVIRAEVAEKIKEIAPATGTTPAVTETRVFVTMAQRTYAETQVAALSAKVEEVAPTTKTPETLDDWKELKRAEISADCEAIIYAGINVTLADGTVEHFSLTEHDQLNLFGKQAQLNAGAEQLEYHADGQPCRYYSAADMQTIIDASMFHVSYHTTYCNSINMWIAGCDTVDELQTIFYGADVPEEYQSDVLKTYLLQIAQSAENENDAQTVQ